MLDDGEDGKSCSSQSEVKSDSSGDKGEGEGQSSSGEDVVISETPPQKKDVNKLSP